LSAKAYAWGLIWCFGKEFPVTAKQHIVRLTPAERFQLGSLIAHEGASTFTQRRARILLHADVGQTAKRMTDVEIGGAAAVEARTVARVRKQFAQEGLAATLARRQRGDRRPRKLEGEAEARLIVLACADPPAGHTRWTVRLLAQRLIELEIVPSISPETVRTALKKTDSSRGAPNAGAFLASRVPSM
jgi:hypothetical protein